MKIKLNAFFRRLLIKNKYVFFLFFKICKGKIKRKTFRLTCICFNKAKKKKLLAFYSLLLLFLFMTKKKEELCIILIFIKIGDESQKKR
jgi:hypothetical protein